MEKGIEVFKPINYPGLEEYEISNYGVVKHGDKIKKQSPRNGYRVITVKLNGKWKGLLVHRLLALTFLPNDNPEKMEVNHKDECKSNNFVYIRHNGKPNLKKSNLEWVTHLENMKWGTITKRKIAKNNKLCNSAAEQMVAQYSTEGEFIALYKSVNEAARITGYLKGSISKAINGELHTAHGYIWKRKNNLEL